MERSAMHLCVTWCIALRSMHPTNTSSCEGIVVSDYRRWYQPGGTSFFTVVSYKRFRLFEDAAARALLGNVMRDVAAVAPFETVAIVLLPDHLHAIWALPPGVEDYSRRWKRIKADFTDAWLAQGGKEMPVTPSQARRGARGVWQRRFIEHLVRDEEDLERHCDYIHYNPVKHEHAGRPWDWPHSSFRRFVELGQYEWDWGRSEPESIKGLDYELYD
jgi:putative transposase